MLDVFVYDLVISTIVPCDDVQLFDIVNSNWSEHSQNAPPVVPKLISLTVSIIRSWSAGILMSNHSNVALSLGNAAVLWSVGRSALNSHHHRRRNHHDAELLAVSLHRCDCPPITSGP